MSKGEVEHLVVCALHPLGNFITIRTHFFRLDDASLEERDDCDRQHQRHHEVDGNGNREVLQTVVEHTFHRDEERIEDSTDADGSQQHRHKILTRRFDGGIKGFEAFAQILQIAVDDHNRVIDNHSQHHHHIHDSHTHKSA